MFSKGNGANGYTIQVVANKYNPSNYWCVVELHKRLNDVITGLNRSGRWRSAYTIDFAENKVAGKVLVNVHYYEQGNVSHTYVLLLEKADVNGMLGPTFNDARHSIQNTSWNIFCR